MAGLRIYSWVISVAFVLALLWGFMQKDSLVKQGPALEVAEKAAQGLRRELKSANDKIAYLKENAYNLVEIKLCTLKSSVRNDLIQRILMGQKPVTAEEQIEYQKLSVVLDQAAKTSLLRQEALLMNESMKLTDECMDRAHLVVGI